MIDQSHIDTLTEGAHELGICLSDDTISSLTVYLETLQRWAKTTDLVSQPAPEIVIHKHILDSLAVSALLSPECRFIDLGSGAGFPGLVLAMAERERDAVLVEPRRKRANFLKDVARMARLKNVSVYESRAESSAKEQDLRESFDAVVTRATWDIETFLSFAEPFLKERGVALVMKGKKGEQELMNYNAHPSLVFSFSHRYDYMLPFGHEGRHVYVFRK
jgi:16S rRNA (guanine527-N7)-methyltransferase